MAMATDSANANFSGTSKGPATWVEIMVPLVDSAASIGSASIVNSGPEKIAAGIKITSTAITDLSRRSRSSIRWLMNDSDLPSSGVLLELQQKDRLINEADAEYNKVVPTGDNRHGILAFLTRTISRYRAVS